MYNFYSQFKDQLYHLNYLSVPSIMERYVITDFFFHNTVVLIGIRSILR